uniref:Uncharacterized protein n=1 Tax=Rousettus aegyptiacus TaxID=9407 RepID=A0A7J8BA42_ROUAE|nr:hypothetical protein HJG63_009898 [Rousettus aegyptiacus]
MQGDGPGPPKVFVCSPALLSGVSDHGCTLFFLPQQRCLAQKRQNALATRRMPRLRPEEEVGVSTSGCLLGATLWPLVWEVETVLRGPGWGAGLEVPEPGWGAGLVAPHSGAVKAVLVSASSCGAGLVVPDAGPAEGALVPNSGVGAGMAALQSALAAGLAGSWISQPDGRTLWLT